MRNRSIVLGLLAVLSLLISTLYASPATSAQATPGSEVAIRAHGVAGSEVIRLQLNNKIVASFTLTTSARTYSYRVSSTTTVDKLRVYFGNDGPGLDVNIDYVALDGVRYESEAPTTWSVGGWRNGRCSPGNDSVSPWLRCNGYLKYTDAEGTVLRGPQSPTAPSQPTPSPQEPQPNNPPTPAAPVEPPRQPTAGHNGQVGCQQNCKTLVGPQTLDGRQNAKLENVIITNPGGRCLTIRNARNITVKNVTFKNCGTTGEVVDGYDTGLILVDSSKDVTIENSTFTNMGSVSSIDRRNNALQLVNSPRTRIVNNEFRDIRSDISQKSGDKGNRAIVIRGNDSNDIKIVRNSFYNPGRNAVQMIRVRGVSGVEIANNRIEGRGPWDSDFEDMINLYSSSGTATSNIRVSGNYMRNGGPSNTGTAIIIGDGSRSVGPTQYVTVEDNVIVDSGHVGISLAGGDHLTIKNNIVYSNHRVPNDRKNTVGFVMHHFNYSERCFANTVTGNRVYQKNQLLSRGVNHVWDTRDCGVAQDGNVWGDSSLSYSIWPPDL